jgi:glycosyltransferase involved in cell wall biosynthesis
VAPPLERVPPIAYGGTERIVHGLATELTRRGHDVTTFASGDSDVPGRHLPTVPVALRPSGYTGDHLPWFLTTVRQVLDRADEFDLIHSHLEWTSLLLARATSTPVVSTFHGRLDLPWAAELFADPPRGLVAISDSQAAAHPDLAWEGVVHNGLALADAPFERRAGDGLCFVGRVAPEKGVVEAIEIARLAGRPLRIAAKVAPAGPERAYHDEVFLPALEAAGSDVEFLGELTQPDRDRLFAESYASLMPGAWPEPFGLVAIEALATGTPIIARRIGALPEIIREGVDGFFGDDVTAMAFRVDAVAGLDRAAIRASVLSRFSVERMTDDYEAIYRRVLGSSDARAASDDLGVSDGREVPDSSEPAVGPELADHRASEGVLGRSITPPARRLITTPARNGR